MMMKRSRARAKRGEKSHARARPQRQKEVKAKARSQKGNENLFTNFLNALAYLYYTYIYERKPAAAEYRTEVFTHIHTRVH